MVPERVLYLQFAHLFSKVWFSNAPYGFQQSASTALPPTAPVLGGFTAVQKRGHSNSVVKSYSKTLQK